MSPSTIAQPATTFSTYAPPADAQAAIAAYIACILEGRPYPDAQRRATAVPSTRPDTVQEGIERILRGSAAR